LCRQNLFKPLKFSAILAFFLITQLAGKTQAWKLYSDSADALKNQKNFNDAISYYIKAKKLLEPDSVTTDAYTKLCTNLGDVYFTLNDYDSSEIYYLQTKNIAEKIHKNDKSVQRMLSPKGNPTTSNFCLLLNAIQKAEGITFEVNIR